MKVTHLYIHLPFCARRCDYCDFFSTVGASDLAPAYVEGLITELEEADALLGSLKTVYLGGGTPTLLGPELLGKLLEAVRARISPGAEVTVEANPVTVTFALAVALGGEGVTRSSLGVQSFDPQLRRNLGRSGSADAVPQAMLALRGAGFDNIGLDLIFGIPGQSLADLKEDLRLAVELCPDHISCYELSVREGSRFQKRWAPELKKTGEAGSNFYEAAVEALEAAGYHWYETSNFALPGKECRHNLAYWSGADYVGIGAGAWSTVGLKRWRNSEDVRRYIEGAGDLEKIRRFEQLSHAQKAAEQVMLGLRTDGGVLVDDAGAIDSSQQNNLQRNGFLQTDGDRIYLTRSGRFVANEVCARLLRSWECPAVPGGPGDGPAV